ncbi:MAG: hypothetical protein RMM58_08585 [Chloroflexota bacterium]|nr:hypothetical protein [Dehalococcoidia bacterium]MDW8253921.1 hypothetical protein [Chloroflexota bacterium]
MERRWSLVANGRLGAAVLVVGGVLVQNVSRAAAAGGPAALVLVRGRLEGRRRRLRLLEQLNAEAELRFLRRGEEVPVRHRPRPPEGHPAAANLGLVGRAPQFYLLDCVGGTPAEPVLARWLLPPAPLEEARRRQAAVRELAPKVELQKPLVLLARLAAELRGSLERSSRGRGNAAALPAPLVGDEHGRAAVRGAPGHGVSCRR